MLLCMYMRIRQLSKQMTNSGSDGWQGNLQIMEEGQNGKCDNGLELETPV